jgi:hypothetical protein
MVADCAWDAFSYRRSREAGPALCGRDCVPMAESSIGAWVKDGLYCVS